MRRTVPLYIAVGLVVLAFVAGFIADSAINMEGPQAHAQTPAQTPSQTPGKSRTDSGKASVTGTIEAIQGNRLTVRVQEARGSSAQPGKDLTVDLGPNVDVTREITVSELRKGETVTLRGATEGNRFTVLQILVVPKR